MNPSEDHARQIPIHGYPDVQNLTAGEGDRSMDGTNQPTDTDHKVGGERLGGPGVVPSAEICQLPGPTCPAPTQTQKLEQRSRTVPVSIV